MSAHPSRATDKNPCPVCGHPDWCLLGDHYILCMRVPSEKHKLLKGGESGWLHPVGADYVKPKSREKPHPVLRSFQMMESMGCGSPNFNCVKLAKNLGVSELSLQLLNVGWYQEQQAWAFPMRDGNNGVVGIRLRNDGGKKWAVPGSHQGLFIPQTQPFLTMLVCEGPTDTAAALTMGYYAVGRPSCSGGVQHIIELVKRLKIMKVVIIADLDDPGMRGAQTLQEHLPVRSVIALLPSKDIREFLNQGGNRETLDSIINQLVWRQPHANLDTRSTQ